MDTKVRISYNFHTHEVSSFSDIFQLVKKKAKHLKTIHSSWAVQTQVVDQEALVCQTSA